MLGTCAQHDGVKGVELPRDFEASRLTADFLHRYAGAENRTHCLGLHAQVMRPQARVDGLAVGKVQGVEPGNLLAQAWLQGLSLGGVEELACHALRLK